MATRKADAPAPEELRQKALELTLINERAWLVQGLEEWITRGRGTSSLGVFGRSIHLPRHPDVSTAPYEAASIQFIEQVVEEYRNVGWKIELTWDRSKTATNSASLHYSVMIFE